MLPGQKEKHPQVESRKIRFFTDQHGRKWWANIQGKSEHPCETLKPKGWRPPVKGGLPETLYFRFNVDPDNIQRVDIDYDRLIEPYRASFVEWARERDRQGRRLLKSAYDPQQPSDEVLDVVGPLPFPWQYWVACKEEDAVGHLWALGLSDERPEWADQFFVPREVSVSFLRKPNAKRAGRMASADANA